MNFRAIKRDSLELLCRNFGQATVVFGLTIICSAVCFFIFQAGVAFGTLGRDFILDSSPLEVFRNILGADTSDSRKIILPLVAASIFSLFSITQLRQGITRWHYILAVHGSAKMSHIFHFFAHGYFRALWFEIIKVFRLGIAVFLCFLPSALSLGIGLRFTLDADQVNPLGAQIFTFLALVLGLLGGILYMILSIRLFLARFIFVSDQETSPAEAFRKSNQIMNGKSASRIETELSLVGWYALCLLLLPVSFVIPLRSICLANFAREILSENKKSL